MRFETDKIAQSKYDANKHVDKPIVDRVSELAKSRGLTRTQISLAWLLHRDPVAAPVIGSYKMEHLLGAVDAVSVSLSVEEVAFLEELYVPHPVQGHA